MIAHEIFEQPEMHELEFDQAIKYLRKEDPGCKLPEGYQLVAYKNVALGWVKGLSNRNNNLLPASLRLVKQQFSGNPLLSANHVQFV
jgi:NOL1/NOP2/fmu family ribosome biogenesis protein